MPEYSIENLLPEFERLLPDLERRCEQFIREQMASDNAHDIAHIKRVVSNARRLAIQEDANLVVVVMAAWLHDLVNYPKNHPKRHLASSESARQAQPFFECLEIPPILISDIQHAIASHSYSADLMPQTLEAKVVQDADRLDALGAIGIARCMMVGGQLDRTLYEINDPFCEMREANDQCYTLDHFYQKLLRLHSSFHTSSARHEAFQRTLFMQDFLRQMGREISE